MSEVSSARISLYIALLMGACTGILVYLFDRSFTSALLALVLAVGAGFIISKLLLDVFLFGRIKHINDELYASIKNEKFKTKIENTSAGPLDKLDISVRRLIKEKTIEIDNLKELERMRKEFLGDVAHELRSPIFNIQGYIHTLIEGAWQDEAVSQKFLEKAAKHVDHLSSLVEDLVTISRIEAGELKLEKTAFDLKELAQEVVDLQDLTARQKNISVQIKSSAGETVPVLADRQKIRQVLNNLVSNSIKYGRQGGSTVITLNDTGQTISIEVADNGEGIAQEHLPRIFERFYRVDKSRARNQVSTGLGLAIVKHFIEAHRHKILVTSREGVGSIFSFSLDKANG